MKKLSTGGIGVDQGDEVLFSDFEDGGEMWTGEGPRVVRRPVTFGDRFLSPPSVSVSLSMVDMSNSANIRMDVQAEDVTKTGFDIVFRTWGDTRIARARVAWQAIGAVLVEDAWEV